MVIQDKLFLLSETEVSSYLQSNQKRCCRFKNKHGYWWLRSMGWDNNDVKALAASHLIAACHVKSSSGLVRPALYIRPEYFKNNKPNSKGYIDFAGRRWIVLNITTGLLLLKDAVGKRSFDNHYSNYTSSGIRNYLNKVLLHEMFTDEEQKLIRDACIKGELSYPAA